MADAGLEALAVTPGPVSADVVPTNEVLVEQGLEPMVYKTSVKRRPIASADGGADVT